MAISSNALAMKFKRHIPLVPYYIEAFWYLLKMKLTILLFPFKRYSKAYGHPHSETLHDALSLSLTEIKAISIVLRVLPRYLPWKSKCLDQAMAAACMLKKRHLQYTLYFGLAKTDFETNIAHAWLRSGRHWVIGYQPDVSYAIVGVYAWVK